MTQDEIASKLNVSRSKVVRLLKKAEENGIIHVHILSPLCNCLQVEQKLISTFKLQDAMVVPTGQEENIRQTLGKAGAQYLERHLKSDDLLATGWGRTIFEIANFIRPNDIKNLRVVTLHGGLTTSLYLNPYDIGGKLASIFDGQCYYIHAPHIADSEKLCKSLKSDSMIKQTLEMAKLASCSLVGIGETSADSTLAKLGYINLTEMEKLRQQGAVGNVLGQFFSIKGEEIDCDLHKRIVALSLKDLKKMKNVIGIAGSKSKIKAILGALRGGFIKILVTDEEAAKEVMNLEE
jgi:DNA-binding transcriptional regulator LsrR (DeoR family)